MSSDLNLSPDAESPAENTTAPPPLPGIAPRPPVLTPRLFWASGGTVALLLTTLLLLWPDAESQGSAPPLATNPVLTPAALRAALPATAVEGQPVTLRLRLSAAKPDTAVRVSYQGLSYAGTPLQREYPLQWQGKTLVQPLIFEHPGEHQVHITNASGQSLKTLKIKVSPFPARVFPADWEAHQNLSKNPSDYQLLANLYFDPEKSPQQRQYLQIIYQGQLLERLLISGGAPGHDTPLGQFALGFKDYYPRSRLYNNTPMPFFSEISIKGHPGEFGFHALEDGGYLYLLGKPASHGCVRLSRRPSVETDPATGRTFWGDRGGARWIYDRVPSQVAVTIFKAALPAFVFEDYAHWEARPQTKPSAG
jgi:hypothetical protein